MMLAAQACHLPAPTESFRYDHPEGSTKVHSLWRIRRFQMYLQVNKLPQAVSAGNESQQFVKNANRQRLVSFDKLPRAQQSDHASCMCVFLGDLLSAANGGIASSCRCRLAATRSGADTSHLAPGRQPGIDAPLHISLVFIGTCRCRPGCCRAKG